MEPKILALNFLASTILADFMVEEDFRVYFLLSGKIIVYKTEND